MFERLLNWLYPPRCLFCGKLISQEAICEACRASIYWIEAPSCPICGRRAEDCACRGRAFVWDGCAAVACYGDTVKAGITSFKFHSRKYSGSGLGRLMARRVKETFPDVSFDWIIPAPLGRKRFKKRGYNQAELLAHEMEKQLGILCRTDVLHKKRDTPQQSKLSKYQRQKNLDGTFFVKKPSAIRGRTVLLVDDVSTTGATLRECARTLKDAGARRVYCAVFALSLPQKSRQ